MISAISWRCHAGKLVFCWPPCPLTGRCLVMNKRIQHMVVLPGNRIHFNCSLAELRPDSGELSSCLVLYRARRGRLGRRRINGSSPRSVRAGGTNGPFVHASLARGAEDGTVLFSFQGHTRLENSENITNTRVCVSCFAQWCRKAHFIKLHSKIYPILKVIHHARFFIWKPFKLCMFMILFSFPFGRVPFLIEIFFGF